MDPFIRTSKHILIALHLFEGGGAERQALYLSQGLMFKKYRVTVIGFGNGEGLARKWFDNAGIQTIPLGFREKLILNGAGLRGVFLKYKYQLKLIWMVRKLKADYIIPFTYPPNVIFGTLWKWMGVRACFWNQRDEGRSFRGSSDEIFALNNCSSIISNSTEGEFFLKKYTNHSIQIIHNGISLFQIKPSVINQKTIRVIMIANLHGHKDHFTLLKAWKIVIDQLKENKAELILVGREGGTASEIRLFINENQLVQCVQLMGEVSDVQSILTDSDIGVFSSVDEGLPNGILECMSAGLPVVATRIRGSEDALGNEYPFLSEPFNQFEMAELLLELIRNERSRVEWGKINRARIEKEFSIDKMVARYIESIEHA